MSGRVVGTPRTFKGISTSIYMIATEYHTPPHELYEKYSVDPWRMGYDMKVTEIGHDVIEEQRQDIDTGARSVDQYDKVSDYAQNKKEKLKREIGYA